MTTTILSIFPFYFFFTVTDALVSVKKLLHSACLLRHLSEHLRECPPNPLKLLSLKLLEASLILVIKVSFSRNLLRFTLLLTTDQNCSIGLSSGEYEGK